MSPTPNCSMFSQHCAAQYCCISAVDIPATLFWCKVYSLQYHTALPLAIPLAIPLTFELFPWGILFCSLCFFILCNFTFPIIEWRRYGEKESNAKEQRKMQNIKKVTTVWHTILIHKMWDSLNASWHLILMTNTAIRKINGTNYAIHLTKIMKAGRGAKLISSFCIIVFV